MTSKTTSLDIPVRRHKNNTYEEKRQAESEAEKIKNARLVCAENYIKLAQGAIKRGAGNRE